MWLLLIIAVALLWLYSRSQGSAASASTSGGDTDYPGGALSDLMKIPDGLAAAVAQVESGNRQYDSNGNVLTSPAGALGIMQLEPATAAQLGVDPNDPTENVAGGTEYLNQLYKEFNGDLNNTLAAYNWGPGNVQTALQNGTPFPGSVQSYVQKVLSIFGGGS